MSTSQPKIPLTIFNADSHLSESADESIERDRTLLHDMNGTLDRIEENMAQARKDVVEARIEAQKAREGFERLPMYV